MTDLVFALLAGIATVAAPCTLPMLPIILGASVGQHSPARPALIALGFVASFAAVALALSAAARSLSFDPAVLRSAASIVLVAFGALMIWPRGSEWLALHLPRLIDRGDGARRFTDSHALGGLLLGATLGLVWTPCAGPVLGSILTVIATSGSLNRSGLLLVTYGIGAALPMLAIAYGGQFTTTRLRRIAPLAPRLQQAFGVLVVAVAAATYLQYDTEIVSWLTAVYPPGLGGL
jgi:cytochrome c-type biogenesis protein